MMSLSIRVSVFLLLLLLLSYVGGRSSPKRASRAKRSTFPTVPGTTTTSLPPHSYELSALSTEIKQIIQQVDNKINAQDFHGALPLAQAAERKYGKTHWQLIHRVGNILANTEKSCEAIPYFIKNLKFLNGSSSAHFHLAICYTNCNKHKQAVEQYEKVYALNNLPQADLPGFYYMYASSHKHLGNWKKSMSLFKQCQKLDPNFTDVAFHLGEMMERSGLLQPALEYYAQAIKHNRAKSASDVRADNRYAAVLIHLNRSEEARPYLQNYLRHRSDIAPYYNRRPAELSEFISTLLAPQSFNPAVATGSGQRSEYTIIPLAPLNNTKAYNGPTLFMIDDFLSKQECEQITKLFDALHATRKAEPLLCFVKNPKMEKIMSKDIFRSLEQKTLDSSEGDEVQECVNATAPLLKEVSFSTSTYVYHGQDALLDVVHHRLDHVLGLPPRLGASSQILRYTTGEDYDVHTDCAIDTRANDRTFTVLLYLTDVEEGGATCFPRLNKCVEPKQGRLAIFTSLDKDGFCDIRSQHLSAKVKKGTKYVIQKWYHSNEPSMDDRATIFKHCSPNQSLISCDYSQSCREYIKYIPGLIQHPTELVNYPILSKKDEL